MERNFKLSVIAERLITGFAGIDLPAKLETAAKLPTPLTPYSVGDADVVLLNAPVVAQLLNTLLRNAYKRLAYTFAAATPVGDAVAGMSQIEQKMRDAMVKAGKTGDTDERIDADGVIDLVDDTDSLFESMGADQENLYEDQYRPERAEAEYDVAMLECVQYHLARNYKGRQFAWLLDGITTQELQQGKLVTTTNYPCPAGVQQWRSSTLMFITEAMERSNDRRVGRLMTGIAEMGPSYSTPLYSGTTPELGDDFRIHWNLIGAATAEVAGEKAAFAFLNAVEIGDVKRCTGALKKWELMLSSIEALSHFDGLVGSEEWKDATERQYERQLERTTSRAAQAGLRAIRARRIAYMESGLTGVQADVEIAKEDAAKATAEALEKAKTQAEVTKAATDAKNESESNTNIPAQRTVGPKRAPKPDATGQSNAGKNAGKKTRAPAAQK